MVNDTNLQCDLKTSCLQVFLYTDIDRLTHEASLKLLSSNHNLPLYAIVANPHLKIAIQNQLSILQGHHGFIKIGVIEEILNGLLEKHFWNDGYKLHDKNTLTMGILELLKTKDPSLSFLNLNAENKNLFSLAKKLAQEILEVEEFSNNELLLIESLKKLMPKRLFIFEGLNLLIPFLNQMLWIGFSFLRKSYLEILEKSASLIFCLVPTKAYLGDILSPKERLKILKKYSKWGDEAIAEEHLLLAEFTQDYQKFYKLLSNYLTHEEIEEPKDPKTSLSLLQSSLQEGIDLREINYDGTICIQEAYSPYQECLQAISYLQKFKENHPETTQKDILFITSDKNLYAPLLQALITNLTQPFIIKQGSKSDPLWQVLEFFLVTPIPEMNQEFFIELGLKLSFVNHAKFKPLENIWFKAHQGLIEENKDELKADSFVIKLKNAILRSSVFDLEEAEIAYESNFINSSKIDDLKSIIIVLDELITLIEKLKNIISQNYFFSEWIHKVLDLVEEPLLRDCCPLSWKKTFIELFADYKEANFKLEISEFCQLISPFLKILEKDQSSSLEIIHPKQIPHQRYELIIYLGMNPEKNDDPIHLLENINKQHESHYYPLWFKSAKKDIYYSYLQGYPDKSMIEAHPWVESLKTYLQPLPKTSNTQLLSYYPKPRREFYTEAINEVLESLLILDQKFVLDFQAVEKFLKDPEAMIRKDLLIIKQRQEFSDIDLKERHLLIWKLQNQLCHRSLQGIDDFKELKSQENEAVFLRSSSTNQLDELSTLTIQGELDLFSSAGFLVKIKGITKKSLESKFSKNRKKIENLIKLNSIIINSL
jgi:hypothetical protein